MRLWFAPSILFLMFISLSSCHHQIREVPTLSDADNESARINRFFEKSFETDLKNSPQLQTELGIKTDYDRLDDYSEEFQKIENERARKNLQELHSFKFDSLSIEEQTSYRLFENETKQKLSEYEWRFHYHPFNQMFGYQSSFPAFLINKHTIDNENEALAYISRVAAFSIQMDQVLQGMADRERRGIIPPRFVFEKVKRDTKNLLRGLPLTNDTRIMHPIYEDFTSKISKVKYLSRLTKMKLSADLGLALQKSMAPSYRKFLGYWAKLYLKAKFNNGAWALPQGEAYYKSQLIKHTTTDLTAKEIHLLGLSEVNRIQSEMGEIARQLHFQGSLKDFFSYLKTSPHFYYPNTDGGRKEYISEVENLMRGMNENLARLLTIRPNANLIVKSVEPFREKSAGLAFYESPSEDGKRPGIYYLNTYNMKALPKWAMAALAHHEGLPGHHLQIAIATQLKGLPRFRRYTSSTAFIEGWGLYAEYIPKELGSYGDLYSDFGRLYIELCRACRLVVDTGIHFQKWTREQSIKYLTDQTPIDEREALVEVERYFISPGQATAYKIGMIKILDLRERAKLKLKDKFELPLFHDEVLRHGSLPLNILEEKIMSWIELRSRS
ncbi:MAG: DUF885 domain-containing protein [Bdellovibrionales bacterium]|nr:DUF885 domain-containing protein [Bdellovibrionales bacterium]